MSGDVKVITTEPGFITIDTGSGPPRRISMKTLLTQPDIPIGLDHVQVYGLTILGNLLVVLVRTLIARGVLDETFADSAGLSSSLDQLIHVIEGLGGAYHNPDLDNPDN